MSDKNLTKSFKKPRRTSKEKAPSVGKLHAISSAEDVLSDVARNSDERALLAAFRRMNEAYRDLLIGFAKKVVEEQKPRMLLHLVPGGQAR